jgi:3-deoxy-D-manno-octulosonate 8-phosphate phosphatase KdsC-like HAD superfamily phosphatase
VEREYVVVSVHGGNGAARKLCAALIQEMNT